MDALIHHLEARQELSAREVEVAADLLLNPSVADAKKERLLEELSRKKAKRPPRSPDSWRRSLIHCGGSASGLARSRRPDARCLRHRRRPIESLQCLHHLDVRRRRRRCGGRQTRQPRHHLEKRWRGRARGARHPHRSARRRLPPLCRGSRARLHVRASSIIRRSRRSSPVRKSLAARGVRTIFNLIGPLLNPAKPQCQLVGVFSRDFCPVFAEILQRLGRESAWVVHGTTGDGRSVDEVSLMGSTRICKSGLYQDTEDEEIRPRDFDLSTPRSRSFRVATRKPTPASCSTSSPAAIPARSATWSS